MNLAEIRKKSLNQKKADDRYEPIRGEKSSDSILTSTLSVDTVSPENALASPCRTCLSATSDSSSGRHDPLQKMFAGREASGLSGEAGDERENAVNHYEEYLTFRLADETYGVNIMEMREIIKPREVTEMPCAPLFLLGIISLRGVIVPVLDMRIRLNLGKGNSSETERIIVVKHEDGFFGLLVDEVLNVAKISSESIEPSPGVLDAIGRDFVSGIGRAGEKMIIMLDLEYVADMNIC